MCVVTEDLADSGLGNQKQSLRFDKPVEVLSRGHHRWSRTLQLIRVVPWALLPLFHTPPYFLPLGNVFISTISQSSLSPPNRKLQRTLNLLTSLYIIVIVGGKEHLVSAPSSYDRHRTKEVGDVRIRTLTKWSGVGDFRVERRPENS